MNKSEPKLHKIIITFDKVESGVFGGLQNQSLVLTIPEDQAKALVTQFHEGSGILSVFLGKDSAGNETWKYVNTKNILYIDEFVIADNSKETK